MLAGRLRSPLPFVLATIFAAFHPIAVGGAILEKPAGRRYANNFFVY